MPDFQVFRAGLAGDFTKHWFLLEKIEDASLGFSLGHLFQTERLRIITGQEMAAGSEQGDRALLDRPGWNSKGAVTVVEVFLVLVTGGLPF